MDSFDMILDNVENKVVFESLLKTKEKLSQYNNISCSVSGGADSDIMLDLFEKCKPDGKKINYVWFDTGLEYQATKDHIKCLEEEYDVEIEKYEPIKPIPITVKEYGVPFLSKHVSEMISRLQKHNFKWEDKPYDALVKEYPKCKCALKWWCNNNASRFNISRNKYLKEFILHNPPTFKISNKCCHYAKKDVGKKYNKSHEIDLNCVGVRKSEGGVRATAYKSCFSTNQDKYDDFRPIFWYSNSDKEYYEKHFSVEHSKCYTMYGMKRTGCCGCPYGRDFEKELEIIQKYEPKLYKACINIFGQAYEYTRKYREFVKERKAKEKESKLNATDI